MIMLNAKYVWYYIYHVWLFALIKTMRFVQIKDNNGHKRFFRRKVGKILRRDNFDEITEEMAIYLRWNVKRGIMAVSQ